MNYITSLSNTYIWVLLLILVIRECFITAVAWWSRTDDSAVFDYEGYSLAGGLLAMYAWRSYVYFILLFLPLTSCWRTISAVNPPSPDHADEQDLLVWTDIYAYEVAINDWLGQAGYFR